MNWPFSGTCRSPREVDAAGGNCRGIERLDVPLLDWQRFRKTYDTLDRSHRGLQRDLIPSWLSQPARLNDRIENSAYGESPFEVLGQALEGLRPQPEEAIVDLGSGVGNACAYFAHQGLRVFGLERNPELHRLALAFRQSLPELSWELHLADFLESDWPRSELLYTTSARFTPSVLKALAQRVDTAQMVRAVACLGRPLPLSSPSWQTFAVAKPRVRWNPGEERIPETLFVQQRTCLKDRSECI